MDRTADVVGEQDPVGGASDELVHQALVYGAAAPDDQGCADDDGFRTYREDTGLRGGLVGAVGSDRVREAGLVVAGPAGDGYLRSSVEAAGIRGVGVAGT